MGRRTSGGDRKGEDGAARGACVLVEEAEILFLSSCLACERGHGGVLQRLSFQAGAPHFLLEERTPTHLINKLAAQVDWMVNGERSR